MARWRRPLLFLAMTALSVFLVELGWMRMKSFFGLLIASVAGVLLVAWSLRVKGEPWPAPAPESEPAPGHPPSVSAAGWLGVAGGLALLALAWGLALKDRLGWSLAAVVAAALSLKPVLPLRLPPALPRRWLGGLMLAVMLAAVLFRFHKFGEVPAGMLTVDEPRLMVIAGEFLDGKRETFRTEGSVGYAAFWVEAAAMWLFGEDIAGFRMSAALPGLMLVGLLALLALEVGGARLGLLAAAFTAVCVWPNAFSRQEYIVSSSLFVMVAAPWSFLWGLRRGSTVALVLAGFWTGLCFNLYNPARLVPLMLVLLAVFLWLRRPDWRRALRWSWAPLLGGLVVGLAPLLLWGARSPSTAWQAYLGNLNMEYMAGRDVVAAQGVFAKFDLAFGRILPNLGRVLTMFTTHGGMRPWFLKLDQPLIDQATLFFVLAGLAVSLVRFRQPGYAFFFCWWLLGLTPTLLADPNFHMDERRIMMNLPATMFMAAAGLEGLLSAALRPLRRGPADALALALALALFVPLGAHNWKTYFVEIEQDRVRQDYNHANFDQMLRGVFRQEKVGPVSVISLKKPTLNRWWGCNFENDLVEHWQVLRRIPKRICSADAGYFSGGGLWGYLKAVEPGRDALVVLTPFHYYLQPLLEQRLGGVLVEDIPPVMASDGVNYEEVGWVHDPKSAVRMVRVKPSAIQAFAAEAQGRLYPFTVEELEPPRVLGTRESLAQLFLLDAAHAAALADYHERPGRWRASKPVEFSVMDPWFWVTANNLPGGHQMPLRLRARWTLTVPSGGEYAFGLSATHYAAVKVDGKEAVWHLPDTREKHEGAREGVWGPALALKAGEHALELEQVALSWNGNFNQVVRLLWKTPGGAAETLPLEVIRPPAPRP